MLLVAMARRRVTSTGVSCVCVCVSVRPALPLRGGLPGNGDPVGAGLCPRPYLDCAEREITLRVGIHIHHGPPDLLQGDHKTCFDFVKNRYLKIVIKKYRFHFFPFSFLLFLSVSLFISTHINYYASRARALNIDVALF